MWFSGQNLLIIISFKERLLVWLRSLSIEALWCFQNSLLFGMVKQKNEEVVNKIILSFGF